MSNQTFTPSNAVDKNKEKDWAAQIGMMDWDTTKIVFTKRSLIEFLKYTGTTVDTNFSNISKLPKYAEFGKISSDPSAIPASGESTALQPESTASPKGESDFKPSRRVRTTPGGPSTDLFETEFADDALSQAPPKSTVAVAEPASPPTTTAAKADPVDNIPLPASGVRPSRRVRTAPGGKDSLAEGLWGDPDSTEFKPTRRVRQGPGGQDTVASLLG